jgi:orotidine-5'-phosphate decarboxylase
LTRSQLIEQIRTKRSYLCVGLDTDIEKIPGHIQSSTDPIFEFNKAIIDATRDCCVSYKINTAFYEAQGVKGWEAMERTVKYIGEEHFRIADAKRGDIGNTSDQYAKAFFEQLPFDAVTVAPYMGEDLGMKINGQLYWDLPLIKEPLILNYSGWGRRCCMKRSFLLSHGGAQPKI